MNAELGWWLRHGFVLVLLIAALRFSAYEYERYAETRTRGATPVSVPAKGNSPEGPDLDELRELEGSDLEPAQPRPTTPSLRRLIVDWGPERSAVYVSGRYVGDTPYVGQVSCAPDTKVAVVVLPVRGAPLSHALPCRGHTVRSGASFDEAAASDSLGSLESKRGAKLNQGGDGQPQEKPKPPELTPEMKGLLDAALERAAREASGP